MNKYHLILGLAFWLLIGSCKSTENTANTNDPRSIVLDEILVKPAHMGYQETATKEFDLLHTTLNVRFDYEKQYLYGTAEVTLVPWFYTTDSLVLDARGFDIHEVSLMEKGKKEPLKYTYDNSEIRIALPREFTTKDTLIVFVDYTAKPNELTEGGSNAITSDKGLYFINPLGKEPGKPRQIWTQGETQSSSCWFPTIDRPNQNMTQDIYITADSGYITLSNGLLISSTNNGNGTRTDHWSQKLPHAPYLVMMTIGDFAKVSDKWRGMEVSYYVEKAYEEYAHDIFGNTPEMLEFFSTKLGFTYPWQKYSQIVVRDYVSGAMENTTANVYFDGVQRTQKELLDVNYEYIIAHELIHQWFGDLLTCESWSNLPLNEAFANYGEYLWIEHKYGKLEAENHRVGEWLGYLGESKTKQVPLIRYYYADKEDMFDAHSYNKGGLTLNLLRDYVGDDAYFATMKLYLNKHQYQPVEVHDLRMAFEQVTGQDLNWFFNQWFMKPGHPVLELSRSYDAERGAYKIKVTQTQQDNEKPIYRIPVNVDVYYADRVDRETFVISEAEQTLSIRATEKPLLVVFDATHTLPAVIKDELSVAEYVHQYKNGKTFRDQYDALIGLAKQYGDDEAKNTFFEALSNPFWGIRKHAISLLPMEKGQSDYEKLKAKLIEIAENDPKSDVASEAIEKLNKLEDKGLVGVFEGIVLANRFYASVARSLEALMVVEPELAYKLAAGLRNERNGDLATTVSYIFADKGNAADQDFWEKQLPLAGGYDRYAFLSDYGDFLVQQKPEAMKTALPTLKAFAMYGEAWYERYAAAAAIYAVVQEYRLILAPEEGASKDNDRSGVILIPNERTEYESTLEELNKTLSEIKRTEKSEGVKRRYAKFE